jgi:hypothetical protein
MSFYQYKDGNVSTSDSDSDSDSDLSGSDKSERPKYIEYNEEFLLVSNSKDRNYQNGETTFNYNLVFGANSSINASDNGTENAFFNRNYNNIKSISVESVLIPNLYLDIEELHALKLRITDFGVRLKKIQDLDYIVMTINGYESNLDGTNRAVSSASNILVVDDIKERVNNSGTTSNQLAESIVVGEGKNIIIGASKSLLYMKNITDCSKKFVTPMGSLNNIKVSFFEPSGKQILLQNDYLSISFIKSHTDGYIILTTEKYFSPEEYSLGDTVILRNVIVNTTGYSSIETFLNRNEGHNIFNLGGAVNEMYNEIHIAGDYSVNLTSGAISNNVYSLPTSNVTLTSGNLLNLTNQNTIFFKVTTVNRRANFTSDLI